MENQFKIINNVSEEVVKFVDTMEKLRKENDSILQCDIDTLERLKRITKSLVETPNNKINEIVNYMISEGTEQTNEGNYCFYLDELKEKFSISFEWLEDNLDEIMEELELKQEVSYVDFEYADRENDSYFSIYFNLDYCGIEQEE